MTEKPVPGVRSREAEIKELDRRVQDPKDPYTGEDPHEGVEAE